VVRWGRAPGKLYHSQDVRGGTEAVIECLTGGRDYWFVVDSFNDSGVTFGSEVVTAEAR
jgi:xylan 1,4-beta-xylosidase